MNEYKSYKYEKISAIPRKSPKTWLYRVLKNKETFYFRFEVSKSLEKAKKEGGFITPEIRETIKTQATSLVHKFLDQEREEAGTWILMPRECRTVTTIRWKKEIGK
jgi:hypothetical protein